MYIRNKGITLIALIVTIIILLILAGITMVALSGDNGLFKRVKEARNEYEKASIDEENKLKEYENKINEGLDENSVNMEKLSVTDIFASSEYHSGWLAINHLMKN